MRNLKTKWKGEKRNVPEYAAKKSQPSTYNAEMQSATVCVHVSKEQTSDGQGEHSNSGSCTPIPFFLKSPRQQATQSNKLVVSQWSLTLAASFLQAIFVAIRSFLVLY